MEHISLSKEVRSGMHARVCVLFDYSRIGATKNVSGVAVD